MLKKDCISWEGPCAGAGEECEDEGAADNDLRTDSNSHFPFPVLLRRDEVEELGKRDAWGENVFTFVSH